jgi:glycosyltransferase involved in cell wall biosynthesis
MYKGYKLGIIVPAYNEEKLIADTLSSIPIYADRIIVIDDASTDSTRKIIEDFTDKRICLLVKSHNQGVGSAIVTGYARALEENIDVAVVMAGDNQMSAKYLPTLINPIVSGKADYTKGNRLSRMSHRQGMSNWRFFGNWVLTLLTKLSSGYWKISDPQNGYTAITKETIKRIELDKVYPRYGYCNDLLVKLNVAGARVVDVPIPARYGKEKSKIRYSKFITTVFPLLVGGFVWRINQGIFKKRGTPLPSRK